MTMLPDVPEDEYRSWQGDQFTQDTSARIDALGAESAMNARIATLPAPDAPITAPLMPPQPAPQPPPQPVASTTDWIGSALGAVSRAGGDVQQFAAKVNSGASDLAGSALGAAQGAGANIQQFASALPAPPPPSQPPPTPPVTEPSPAAGAGTPAPPAAADTSSWIGQALGAAQQAGGDVQQFASNFQADSGNLIGSALSAAQRSGADIQQFASALPALPTPSQPSPTPPEPFPPTAGAGTPAPGGDLVTYARQAAQRAGVDPDTFVAQIQQESQFNPAARSPAGAQGIAQIMPATAKGWNVDPNDPYASLDAAATAMGGYLRQFNGDQAKALAAYNAGPGAVERYGGIPPYPETESYIQKILGPGVQAAKAAGQAVSGAVGGAAEAVSGAARSTIDRLSQFGDPQLTTDEAYAACGPAAAVRFAQMYGRNPSLREATDLAASVGWTSAQGMAGIGSEKALMDKLGVATRVVGADLQAMATEASTGNPITISTPGHYFFADGYDPNSGAFHVGQSGLDLRGGSEWMTAAQMEARMGPIQGALFADNPKAPAPSTADQGTAPASFLDRARASLGSGLNSALQPFQNLGSTTQDILGALGQTRDTAVNQLDQAVTSAASTVGEALQQVPQNAGRQFDYLGTAVDQTLNNLPDVSDVLRVDPSTPLGRIASGEAIGGMSPGDQAQALMQWNQQYSQASEQATERINPARDVPVLGGLINQATNPEFWLTAVAAGPLGRAAEGLAAPGSVVSRAAAEEAARVAASTGSIDAASQAFQSTLRGTIARTATEGALFGAQGAAAQPGATAQDIALGTLAGGALGGVGGAAVEGLGALATRLRSGLPDLSPGTLVSNLVDRGNLSSVEGEQFLQRLSDLDTRLRPPPTAGDAYTTDGLMRAYESQTPSRIASIQGRVSDYLSPLITPRNGDEVASRDLIQQVWDAGKSLLQDSRVTATGLSDKSAAALADRGQFTNKLNAIGTAADQARVSARQVGARVADPEQAMNFVRGEATADRMALGSTQALADVGERDPQALNRVYAYTTAGPPLIGPDKPIMWVTWEDGAPRVVSAHHHYGVARPNADIHATTPPGLQRLMWDPAAVAGDVTARPGDVTGDLITNWEGRGIDVGGGRRIANTDTLVGPSGENDMRMATALASMPQSVQAAIRRGELTDPEQIAAVLLRETPPRSAPVGYAAKQLMNPRDPESVALSDSVKEALAMAGVDNGMRTESLMVDPQLRHVKALYMAGTPAELDRVVPNTAGRTRRQLAQGVRQQIRDQTGKDVPIIFKDITPQLRGEQPYIPSKLISDAQTLEGPRNVTLAPGRQRIVQGYTRAGFPNVGLLPEAAARGENRAVGGAPSRTGLFGGAEGGTADSLTRPITSPPSETAKAATLRQLRSEGLVDAETVARMIGDPQDSPAYLAGVLDFLGEQRQKVLSGQLTDRDVIKAYLSTMSSIRAKAAPLAAATERLAGRGVSVEPGAVSRLGGREVVRPEDAFAQWLLTSEGRGALDRLEAGDLTPAQPSGVIDQLRGKAAEGGFGFGQPMMNPEMLSGQVRPGEFNLTNISDLTDRLNAAGRAGDLAELQRLTGRIKGVGTAKEGFVSHLLGLGDWPTVDTNELKLWLSNNPRLMGQVERAFGTKGSPAALEMRDQLMQRFNELRQMGYGQDIPDNAFQHVMHHWLFDKALDAETTHGVMYDAMRNAFVPRDSSGIRQALPRLATGALYGGVSGGYEAAQQPDATPQSIAMGALGGAAAGAGRAAIGRLPAGVMTRALTDEERNLVRGGLERFGAGPSALPRGAREISATPEAEVARLRLSDYPEDLRPIIEDNAEGIDWARLQRRGVIPDAVSRRMADRYAKDTSLDMLIQNGAAGKAYNDYQIRAIRNATGAQAETLRQAADRIFRGDDSSAALQAFGVEAERLSQLTRVAEGARAESGRGLRAWQDPVRLVGMEPTQAVAELTKALGGDKDRLLQAVKEYQQLVATGAGPLQMADFWAAAKSPPAGVVDWIKLIRYNSMLSGPRTFEVNAISNALELPWRLARDTAASTLRGRPGEMVVELSGAYAGLQQANTAFLDVLFNGITREQAAAGELPRAISNRVRNPIGRGIARALEVPTRGLQAADEWAHAIDQGMSMGRVAARQASEEGLRGDAWTRRTAQILSSPTTYPKLLEQAGQMADRMTYKGEMGNLGLGLQAFTSRAGLLGNLILPFLRASYHITARGIDRSPLGLAGTAIDVARGAYGSDLRASLAGAGPRPRGAAPLGERLGDNVMGSAIFGGLYYEAQQGNISASGPESPQDAALLRSEGWQPYSVRIGDRWVSYANWGPAAIPFAMAAAAAESQRFAKPGANTLELVLDGSRRTAQIVTEQTYLQAIGSAWKGLSDPASYGSQWLNDTITSLIPYGGAVNTIAQAMDPYARRADRFNVLDAIQNRLPPGTPLIGGRSEVPISPDVLGRPLPNPAAGAGAIIPLRSTQLNNDPLLREMDRIGYAPPAAPKTLTRAGLSYQLTPDEQRQIYAAAGDLIAQRAGQEITTDTYRNLTDTAKARRLQMIVDASRTQVENQWLAGLADADFQQRRQQADAARQVVPVSGR